MSQQKSNLQLAQDYNYFEEENQQQQQQQFNQQQQQQELNQEQSQYFQATQEVNESAASKCVGFLAVAQQLQPLCNAASNIVQQKLIELRQYVQESSSIAPEYIELAAQSEDEFLSSQSIQNIQNIISGTSAFINAINAQSVVVQAISQACQQAADAAQYQTNVVVQNKEQQQNLVQFVSQNANYAQQLAQNSLQAVSMVQNWQQQAQNEVQEFQNFINQQIEEQE